MGINMTGLNKRVVLLARGQEEIRQVWTVQTLRGPDDLPELVMGMMARQLEAQDGMEERKAMVVHETGVQGVYTGSIALVTTEVERVLECLVAMGQDIMCDVGASYADLVVNLITDGRPSSSAMLLSLVGALTTEDVKELKGLLEGLEVYDRSKGKEGSGNG